MLLSQFVCLCCSCVQSLHFWLVHCGQTHPPTLAAQDVCWSVFSIYAAVLACGCCKPCSGGCDVVLYGSGSRLYFQALNLLVSSFNAPLLLWRARPKGGFGSYATMLDFVRAWWVTVYFEPSLVGLVLPRAAISRVCPGGLRRTREGRVPCFWLNRAPLHRCVRRPGEVAWVLLRHSAMFMVHGCRAWQFGRDA